MPIQMRRRARRAAVVIGAVIVATFSAPAAFAATGAVYGGSTHAGDAIVLRADAAAKQLKSAVLATDAACSDGMNFPLSFALTTAKPEPGFVPDADTLSMSRNGKGRFSGVQLASYNLGDQSAAAVTSLSGTLKKGRASGVLSTQITILDNATGNVAVTCTTGSVHWSATRAPGRVYGGATSQDSPIVMRFEPAKHRLSDVILDWDAPDCQPDGYYHTWDHFLALPVKAGRWGMRFDQTYDAASDGSKLTIAYDLGGTLKRSTGRGVFQAATTWRDASGATQRTCDSGRVTFAATTG
ncbi:MAG: hypothetical protein QOE28_3067 [Solirubrobacteraceae bacterium]|nr:hypothetical protein [Solirubrobacteraceae bacterium]